MNNFCVFLQDGVDSPASVAVTVRKNGANKTLAHTFTVSDGDMVSKCSTSESVSNNIGDLISVKFEETTVNDPGSPYFMCTMNFTPN